MYEIIAHVNSDPIIGGQLWHGRSKGKQEPTIMKELDDNLSWRHASGPRKNWYMKAPSIAPASSPTT